MTNPETQKGERMTPNERASQIVDKYWKETAFKDPNPYLLEADIAQAITEAQEIVTENAKLQSTLKRYEEALSIAREALEHRFHNGNCLNCGFPAPDCLHTCEWKIALSHLPTKDKEKL